MAKTVETLLGENMHGVISEPDLRCAAPTSQYFGLRTACSSNPDSRYEGHSGFALAADGVAKIFPNFIFTERGKIVAYHGVGKLGWGFGRAGAEAVITGSDVLAMKGDKIGPPYIFIDPPRK